MIITRIFWDTDGDQQVFDSLPQRITAPESLSISNFSSRDEMIDEISDWLSDEYGFCHTGFTVYPDITDASCHDEDGYRDYEVMLDDTLYAMVRTYSKGFNSPGTGGIHFINDIDGRIMYDHEGKSIPGEVDEEEVFALVKADYQEDMACQD